jgi:hypothetical protein
MESIAVLGIASNIIQIVDFSSRIVARGRELYHSTDGRIEEHVSLDVAAQNLLELSRELQRSVVSDDPRPRTAVDQQLIDLKVKTEQIAKDLRSSLENVQLTGPHRKWKSIHQALRTISTDKEVSDIANRLDQVRKQVDTTILVSLRYVLMLPLHVLLIPCRQSVENATKTQTEDKAANQWRENNDHEVRQRHDELLEAIHNHAWVPSKPGDMTAFSQKLDAQNTARIEHRFERMILARLYFPHMPDRVDNIPVAHRQTYEWLFNDVSQIGWASFSNWLRDEGSRIYWIAGKPGSGKSTLMKFLYHHHRLIEGLHAWANGSELIRAGFYLWNSRSVMQMSRLGLLQALLHDCFSEDKSLIQLVLVERWEQYFAFGGGREPFDWPELRRTLERLLSDQSRKFFFLIDGLDEFDGKPREIIDFILDAKLPNVKLCVASRPWIEFEDAFRHQPSLLLEHLTEQDIITYVTEHFHENEHYTRLLDLEPEAAELLTPQIIKKASGVFLWVYLVVQSLLEGLSNADRMSDLKARLDGLPSDLEALFNVILRRLEPQYFKHACEYFRLVRAYRTARTSESTLELDDGNPSLLGLYYADQPNTKSCLQAPCQTLSTREACLRATQMKRRLNARCKGILEGQVRKRTSSLRGPGTKSDLYDYAVSYLHRTARDYIESDAYWKNVEEGSGHAALQPEARWANANLWLRKVHPLANSSSDHLKYRENRCLNSAITLHKETGVIQVLYLNEVYRCRDRLQVQGMTSVSLWAERLVSHESLLEYLVVILHLASPADRNSMSRIVDVIFSKDHSRSSKIYLDALKRLRRTWGYYSAPPALRRLYRLPGLPLYE